MTKIFAAIILGLMGGALQAGWLQQPTQGIPDPWQIDTPHSRDPFDPDVMACASSKDPACGSNIASLPRGGVSARTLAYKHSKAADKAFNQGHRA